MADREHGRPAEPVAGTEPPGENELARAAALLRDGRTGDGGRLAHQVLAWATRHGSPALLARTHRELAVFHRQVGDASDALTHAVQCVAHLTDDVAPAVRARHLLTLATALDESGSPAEADRRFREGLDLATACGDEDLARSIVNNMAFAAYERGDATAAGELVAHLRELQRRQGRPFSANEVDTVARVELLSGRYAAVEEILRELPAGTEGDAQAECLLTLAQARRLDGRPVEAQRALDAARVMCADRGLRAVGARVREEQAALHAATGRYADAYREHRTFHAEAAALHSAEREARARALQAVFEAAEARRASEHFREMAHRDVLTGLHNRRYANDRLPALLGEAAVRRSPLSVAIVDLDHFKRINDTLSHAVGDAVLVEVARLLCRAVTGPAIAARMGGEEFLLIFPGLGAVAAAERCERLRAQIRGHAWAAVTGAPEVSASIGVTTAPDGRATPSALLSRADRNLYAAKRGGRDRVVADLPHTSTSATTG